MVMSHVSLFLDDYENFTDVWNDFVDDLRPPTKSIYQEADLISSMVTTWQKRGRLVLEKVITLVHDKKKQHAREHKLGILPSTTKLRLWLLPYPCFPEPAEADEQCRAFVKELEKLLNTFLQGEANVLRWPRIAEDTFTVSGLLNATDERLRVAIHIGELGGSSGGAGNQRASALNFVKVALAMKLIDDGKDGLKKTAKGAYLEQSQELIGLLKMRIEGWQNNDDEGVREKVAEWKRERKDLWKLLMSEV